MSPAELLICSSCNAAPTPLPISILGVSILPLPQANALAPSLTLFSHSTSNPETSPTDPAFRTKPLSSTCFSPPPLCAWSRPPPRRLGYRSSSRRLLLRAHHCPLQSVLNTAAGPLLKTLQAPPHLEWKPKFFPCLPKLQHLVPASCLSSIPPSLCFGLTGRPAQPPTYLSCF